MFTNLKPYAELRDSRVPSFGHIPSGWQSSRLRGVARLLVSSVDKLTHEHEVAVQLCNYVDVYKNEFISDRLPYMRASASQEEIQRFRVRVDDVVITKDSESWTDIGVPAYVTHEADDLVCGYHLAMLRTNKRVLSGAYLFRALQVPAIAAQFHVASGGVTRYGLSHDDIRSAEVPIPSLDEQAAIVKYLGHANARIDRAIAAKRKLMALLDEGRQAIITQAVTRGLDPTCTLKDSGIQWLHQIPSHWHVAPVGSGASLIQTGPFGGQLHAEEYVAGGTPVINPSHIVREAISADMATSVSREKAHELRRHALETGDVIAARRGELGRCAVISAKEAGWLCGTGSLLIRLKPTVFDAAYFQLAFSSRQSREQLSAGSIGATMANLNSQMVARLRLPRPPLAEQTDIVQAVRAVSLDSTRRISIIQREITVLGEFRTRLTADVVTGQLDVRQAAAKLPGLDPAELVPTEVDDSDDLDAVAEEFFDEVPA